MKNLEQGLLGTGLAGMGPMKYAEICKYMQIYFKICNIYAVIRKNMSIYPRLICKHMLKYAFNMQKYLCDSKSHFNRSFKNVKAVNLKK